MKEYKLVLASHFISVIFHTWTQRNLTSAVMNKRKRVRLIVRWIMKPTEAVKLQYFQTQVISSSFMVPNIAHIHQPERRTDSAIHRDAFMAVTWTPAFPSQCGQLRHRPAAYRGRGAAVLGADAALRLRATATAHVAWQVHASLHLGHPELRRKGCRYKHRFRKNDKRSAETEKPWLCRDVAFSIFFLKPLQSFASLGRGEIRMEKKDNGWSRRLS